MGDNFDNHDNYVLRLEEKKLSNIHSRKKKLQKELIVPSFGLLSKNWIVRIPSFIIHPQS